MKYRRALLMLALCAFLTSGTNAQLQPPLGLRSDRHETPSTRDLLRRLEVTEEELRYLREREQQRSNFERTAMRRLPTIHATYDLTVEDPAQMDGCEFGLCDGDKPVCQGLGPLCNCCEKSFSLNKGPWRIVPFGFLAGEAIGATTGTVARPMILYLNSQLGAGFTEDQFTVHGQTSALGLNFSGPSIGSFQLGGMLLYNYLGSRPVLNQSSPFFLRGYGELKNEYWRITFGQNGDLFNPLDPVTVNFGGNKQAGNAGSFRGSLRAERFMRPSERVQWTLQAAISQQVVNDFVTDPFVIGTDNGWPNVETRVALALGKGRNGQRPFELGVSSVIGEIRSLGLVQVVSDTWGVSLDANISGKRIGVRGEFLVGEAIGTYNAAIGQSLNPDTLQPIATYAAWGDIWVKLTDSLTFHIGYGVDDPRNEDLGVIRQDPFDPTSQAIAGQRSRNEVAWTNLMWDVSEYFDVAFEVSHRETDYIAPSVSNNAMIYHFRSRLKF